MFGWLSIPSYFNPIVILMSFWITHLIHESHSNPINHFRAKTNMLVVPLIASISFFFWMKPITEGTPNSILTRTLSIWDHSAHFLFYFSLKINEKYLPLVQSPSSVLQWEGVEYPTGIHYVWSRLTHTANSQLASTPDSLIPVYFNLVLITQALTLFVFVVSLLRLTYIQWIKKYVIAIGTGLVVGVVAFGPLSQIFFVGFANLSAVIIGISILSSVCIKPLSNQKIQLITVVGAVSILSYNWHPVLLLFIPNLIIEFRNFLRLQNAFGFKTVFFFLAIASSIPIFQTLSLGISHLSVDGGVNPVSTGLLIAALLGSLSIAISGKTLNLENRVIYLGLSPLPLTIFLGLWLRIDTGRYPYYFHKATLSIFFFSIFFIFASTCLAIEKYFEGNEFKAKKQLKKKLNVPNATKNKSVLAPILLGILSSQIFGYTGPDYPTLTAGNSAWGVIKRNDILFGDKPHKPSITVIIQEARNTSKLSAEQKSCLTLFIPDDIGLTSPQPEAWRHVLLNIWFHALNNSYTRQAKEQAYMTPALAPYLETSDTLALGISKMFDKQSVCPFTTSEVRNILEGDSSIWKIQTIDRT